MIRNHLCEYSICSKHNLMKNVLIQTNMSKTQKQQVCRQCADEFYNIIPIEQAIDSNQPLIENFDSQCRQNSIQMNLVINSLISTKQAINKQIECLINEIRNQISFQDNLLKEVKANSLEKEQIQSQHQQYTKNQISFQSSAIQQIEIIKQNHNYEEIIKLLQNMNLIALNEKISQIINKEKLFSEMDELHNLKQRRRFEYQLLSNSSIEYEESFGSIAFNCNASIIVAGYRQSIKVFEFKDEQFRLIQTLQDKGHQSNICCLQFFKNSNQFIYSCMNGMIIVWQQINDQNWIHSEALIGHNDQIQSLLINSKDNMIISGSFDSVINFWKLNNNKNWSFDQKITCSSLVISMSLNEQETKLISCQGDGSIIVLECEENKWRVIQQIDSQTYVLRLCFIDNDKFVILPNCGQNIHFYCFNSSNKQFENTGELQIMNGNNDNFGFPLQFIKSKNLLIIKNSNYVNIARKQENDIFVLDQQIEFKDCDILGSVSNDGQYLITLDKDSLKVRTLLMQL